MIPLSDPVSLTVAGAALGVAGLVGWLWWPRAPVLHGERWFKAALCTLLRGRVESAGGDAGAWEEAVMRFVPWHPAGRMPERKVANPIAERLPSASLPGELELLQDLARLPDAASRWRRIYDEDPVGRAERLADPVELGPSYDPQRWLGYRCVPGESGWDPVATWSDGRVRAAMDRLGWRTLVVAGRPRAGVPSLIPALEAETACDVVPWTGVDETTAAVLAKLGEYSADLALRAIVVAEEAGAVAALRALAESPEGRDRTVAFVAIGGIVAGDPSEEGPLGTVACHDRLGALFAHDKLDTEIVRLTPWFSLGWLDRGTGGALPLEAQRFPPPREDPGAMPMIEAVDLGPLPPDPDLPLDDVARAILLVARCWALSRG